MDSEPPAGWYPDPQNPHGELRWWDGRTWTDHRAPVTHQAAGGSGVASANETSSSRSAAGLLAVAWSAVALLRVVALRNDWVGPRRLGFTRAWSPWDLAGSGWATFGWLGQQADWIYAPADRVSLSPLLWLTGIIGLVGAIATLSNDDRLLPLLAFLCLAHIAVTTVFAIDADHLSDSAAFAILAAIVPAVVIVLAVRDG